MKEREENTPRIFAIVDVETTGTRPFNDRITDLAIIRVEDGAITAKLNTLINPGVPISASIISLSGITNEMVATAPTFEEIALDAKEILDGAIFVAHNAHFDYGFLKNEFRRIGITFKMPTLCTVKLSRSLYPDSRSHDLDALIARHNISCTNRHRAYPDAHVLYEWLKDIENQHKKDVVEEHLDRILGADNLPPLMHRNVLRSLPDTAGIYFFYGKDRELLYVGKSKNIRTRVRSHFSNTTSRKEHKLCFDTVHVETKETAGELSALLLEAQTIKTHMPLYNRALRRARNIVVAIVEKDKNGYNKLSLEQVKELPDSARVSFVFRTITQAKSALRKIAKEQNLCSKLLGVEPSSGPCFGHQIGRCSGACINKEDPKEYNERFSKIFRRRAIKNWPFSGPIVIEEKGNVEGVGAMFFIEDWRLIKSVVYDHGDVQDFIAISNFDYDTYKILARYILDPVNKKSIKEISRRELSAALSQTDHSYENIVIYS